MPTPSRRYAAPVPAPTPPPQTQPLKRKRHVDRPSTSNQLVQRSSLPLFARDKIADEDAVNDAETQCEVQSDNSVFSCFPISNTSIPQHELASFVWNSRLPQFTRTSSLNIYLFEAASNSIVAQWLNHPNPTDRAGVLRYQVNDTWWGDRGAGWDGDNRNFLFYWVATAPEADPKVQGIPQPIFTAVQTTFADFAVASMSSAAAASSSSAAQASLSSAAAAASRSSASAAGHTSSASGGPNPTGNVQSGSGGSQFPHWAIAVIVVLGVLALLASVILTFFILRRIRNNRIASNRNSMGSASPMMANVQTEHTPQSPLLGSAVAGGALSSHRATSPDMHDGASTMSRGSEAAPFSGADAAVMADAFRTALRKPNFADQPVEEGESPDEPWSRSPLWASDSRTS
ncbi:hypothetical protein QCA50_006761 [Cerrena zonata]|uniref:Uncharacterized protein n=1 Tax=Cerrena zonata TaxID=2478898 RepID=A0AAW0G8Y0_9APHY